MKGWRRLVPAGFWRTEWFFGLLLSLGVLLAAAGGWLAGAEREARVLAQQLAGARPAERIAIIRLDAPGPDLAGAWSRLHYARLLDLLAAVHPRVIASTPPFAEPEINPAIDRLEHLRLFVELTAQGEPVPSVGMERIAGLLAEVRTALDGDAQLAASLARAGNVLLPLQAMAEGEMPASVSPSVLASRLAWRSEDGLGVPLVHLRPPLEALAGRAQGLGVLRPKPDAGEPWCKEHLVFAQAGQLYPSLSLAVAAHALGVEASAIGGRPGRDIRLGKLRIRTDPAGAVHPLLYPSRSGQPPFSVDFLGDVLSGRVPASKFADKIVLLGVLARDSSASPAAEPPVVVLAHSVSSILQGDQVVVPSWAKAAGLLAIVLVGAYLVLLLPRLASGRAAWLSLLLLCILLGAYFALLLGAGIWLPLLGPSGLLLVAWLFCVLRRLLQGQASPLALLPEAAVVLEASAVSPGARSSPPAGDELPRLGRYVLERVLGKGAMGKVYQGHDPQIRRPLAIKTMALAQEFDADALSEVRQRFFREAESAGRLSHPNIVTIHDAGEADGLAYIAMELLTGGDLQAHTRPETLLPRAVVLSLVARVADALDYAHRKHVVHRDIKPANIMYDALGDQVKVTDFGVARITDSSRTRTGMVLGTPSYMSPEQLAGQRIDGRADLYALGVMLYQLLSGRLPFVGDSLGKLMFSIANDAPFDILTIKPDLPAGIVAVVAKSLNKNPDRRYQQGAEMAAALRACLEQMESRKS